MFIDGKELHIGWASCGSPSSGYGESGAQILGALASGNIVPHSADDPACEVGVAYMPLDGRPIEALASPVKILYSMFEATRWPDTWVSTANCANEVWVPSKWCADTLVASGCDRPVRIIPLGVNPDVYYPLNWKRPKSLPFAIGFAGAAHNRKGIDLFLKAFLEEFPNESIRILVRSSSHLPTQFPNDARIQIINGVLSLHQMREYYNSIDLLVLPTRGEGFGLTPLEAMSCGCCVAVTDFGGCREYLGEDTLRIAASLVPCPTYRECNGYWAEPSLSSIRYCMRWAYENRKKAREMGMAASERVHREWTWKHTAMAMATALCQVKTDERIPLESVRIVNWRGVSKRVSTSVGQFVRGIPRELTDEEIALLNPGDIRDDGFKVEFCYKRRTAPTADA